MKNRIVTSCVLFLFVAAAANVFAITLQQKEGQPAEASAEQGPARKA